MNTEEIQSDEKGLGYEIFIALVSVLSIINLFLAIIPGVDPDAARVVDIINLFLTIIFIFDFLYRVTTARSKTYYLVRDFGWADILACSPMLRFLRLFRIIKAYRLINKRGARQIYTYLTYHRAEAAIFILLFCVIIILEAGSFLVLTAESRAPDANINTASDALWWAYVTITTVGYGDRYPVTSAGRIVGILVMTTGVGIFATFAGYISNKLLKTTGEQEEAKIRQEKEAFEKQLFGRIDDLQTALQHQEAVCREISARLRTLEQGKGQNRGEDRSEDRSEDPGDHRHEEQGEDQDRGGERKR